ncbi:hypothetical protein Tco_1221527 [Tanacetum coccineum]
MKPRLLSGDRSAVHECTRMVKERLRQAFRATMLVDDTRNESSHAKTHVLNVEEVKRPNRVLNTKDLIRTIMFLLGYIAPAHTFVQISVRIGFAPNNPLLKPSTTIGLSSNDT